jgi:hypothetical protein
MPVTGKLSGSSMHGNPYHGPQPKILIMNFVFVYFTFPPNIFHSQRAKSRLTHPESIFLETQCAFSNNTFLINSC